MTHRSATSEHSSFTQVHIICDDYYYYEPVIPVQDIDPVLRAPPGPLEEERHIDQGLRTPPPRLLEEEQCYPQR